MRRLLGVFRREPMLMITLGYVFVSMIGLWDTYWFYRAFDLPILEYMQSSDYFVSGLRRPAFVLILAMVILTAVLSLLPERWAQRNPERAERMRKRWWGRFLLPRRSDWWIYGGMHPETAAVLVALSVMLFTLFFNTGTRADSFRAGYGQPVSVVRAGPTWPTEHDMRVLGTSSAFVFLWSTRHQRAEVYPIDAISVIRTMLPPSSADSSGAPVPPPSKQAPVPRTDGRMGAAPPAPAPQAAPRDP